MGVHFIASQWESKVSSSPKVSSVFPHIRLSSKTSAKIDQTTAYNSPFYKATAPALIDATPIITLLAAGALIIGKTTTTDFAAITAGGPTPNPHDPTRTPGSSSSAPEQQWQIFRCR
jgi:Asp-tRNA(Asn)/Glu-tRNA(Gln) amidotransferase A subunit family amidase